TVSVDLVLAPSSSTEIPFSIQPPTSPTVSIMNRWGLVSFGDLLNGDQSLAPDVFQLPGGASGAISVRAEAAATGAGTLTIQPVNGALEGPITFAPPVSAISPVAGAVLSRNTEFQTSDPQGALTSHIFNASGGGGGRIFFVHTFEDRVPFSMLETLLEDVMPR